MFVSAVGFLAVAQLATAHFGLEYPVWRDDTLENETYSQWDYPCGGVPYGVGNRTDWPIGGGSISLDLHHPWSYVYINLGLGNNVTNFNVSLTPSLMNVTGNGTFCIPTLPVPVDVSDGQNATVQVVTNGDSGSALYNCADITFRSAAQLLSGEECANSTGVGASIVGQSSTTEPSPTPTTSAAEKISVEGMVWAALAGLMVVSIVDLW